MDVFKDQVYEEMDDLTRLIEPFEYSVNTELSQFPDEIEVSPSMLMPGLSNGWGENYLNVDLRGMLEEHATKLNLSNLAKELSTNRSFAFDIFELKQILDDEDTPMILDAAKGTLEGGKIVIIKKNIMVEDSDIEKKMASHIYEALEYSFVSSIDANKKRLNEVADLFGITKVREERSWRGKVRAMAVFFREQVKERKIPIKDFDLFKRFTKYIILYVKNGSLPAMSNLARIKIMLRTGNPIYSIKEEQV